MGGKFVLDNGLRIVYEHIPYVRSVSCGVWLNTGSRHENEDERGISHLIEHMVFKGTQRRSAKQIAEQIDDIGGDIDAFTAKEITCFYTKTLDTHLDFSLDLLSDMLFSSKFEKQDMEKEKKVIVEEIGMYNDSPEELIHDVTQQVVWPNATLGASILGTAKTLRRIDQKRIRTYLDSQYTPKRCVLAVAGNIDVEAIELLANRYFGRWENETDQEETQPAVFEPSTKAMDKKTEQVHLVLAYRGVPYGSKLRYPIHVLNNILGGSMSSNLFQTIREEHGLAYNVFSYPVFYQHEGLFAIYAAVNPKNYELVIDLIEKEIARLQVEPPNHERLERAKEQLKGSFVLSQESASSRMSSIGRSELMYHRVRTKEEIIQQIDRVKREDLVSCIERLFQDGLTGRIRIGEI